MALPPNPPVPDLEEVDHKTLKIGDTVYVYSERGWKGPGIVSEIMRYSTVDFYYVKYPGEFYPGEYGVGYFRRHQDRFFKRTFSVMLNEKYKRQKVEALQNSRIGFAGPAMNTVAKMIGVKKIPGRSVGQGGRRKTRNRRHRQRRSRKN